MPKRLRRGWLAWLLPMAACAPQPLPAPVLVAPASRPGVIAPGPVAAAAPARERVGLLLPLSGSNAALGQAMLNAAQLALFAGGDARVEFLPRDTGGTPAGAADAARSALAEGARAMAGPLTLTQTAAAAAPARAASTPLFAFTSDATQAGGGVWVLGVTPAEQADRMAGAAIAAGARRLALLAPDDGFGRLLAEGFSARATAAGVAAPVIHLRAPRGDPAQGARELLAKGGPEGFDAVLLGEVGERARLAAAAVAAGSATPPRLLGPAVWMTDASLAQEPALIGALFPGPDPGARARFEASYQDAFGERPPSLAGVAYDAAALASLTARGAGLPPIGSALLGADGPLRLLPEGRAQRGLALFSVEPGGEPRLVQPATLPGAVGS